ncbi:MAG: hypothetical protein GPJ54_08350 [Candidatus Heimdallarchaeota archaeon]|nr:hypothetical protein [Candidatus Heimdallarchaeota archaeon]
MVKLYFPIRVGEQLINQENVNLENLYPAKSFGRVPFYALVESNTAKTTLIPNTNHHFGGKDLPWDIAINSGADAILAVHMCERPYTKLKNYNVPIYGVDANNSLKQIVDAFNSGELKEIEAPEPGAGCSSGHNH